MYINPEAEAPKWPILVPRQNGTQQDEDQGNNNRDSRDAGNTTTIAIIAVVIFLIVGVTVSYCCLRRARARGRSPKYLPGSRLKRWWESWTPKSKYSSIQRGHSANLSSENAAYRGVEVEERAATQAAAAGVDRNTSVRSVMTLPAYSQSPKDTEQVIGREGEREGMDTVVEYPENQDEEEARREEQMESLYQIRLARRREIAEREERRRERREARERGDFARLEELRQDSRQRAYQSNDSVNGGVSASAATLIAEHQSRGRERRVSAVSYGDLGQVRHDGTRIRANSNESERGGLLDGAAPMGEGDDSSNRPRGSSESRSLAEPRPHFRNGSTSSALSISTTASDIDRPAFTPVGSERPRTSGSNNTSDSSPTANRFTPEDSGSGEGDDIGESRIPANITITTTDLDSPSQPRPPQYEHLEWGDAPAYTEQEIAARRASQRQSQRQSQQQSGQGAPQLPELNLPSISVEGATEPNTPVMPNAVVGNPNEAQR